MKILDNNFCGVLLANPKRCHQIQNYGIYKLRTSLIQCECAKCTKNEGGFTKCIPDLQGRLLQSSAALYLLQAVHDLKCLQQVHQTQNTATWTVPNGTWFGQMSFLRIPSTQTNGVLQLVAVDLETMSSSTTQIQWRMRISKMAALS